jgi:hypothetical protein
MQQPTIAPGKENDPSVTIASARTMGTVCKAILEQLGFTEDMTGAFVYHARGRAIWVNPVADPKEIVMQIVDCGEAIGRRAKINEFRAALDLPFGEVNVVKPSHES